MWKTSKEISAEGIINKIEDFPEGTVGFVYSILNLTLNKKYIGKKDLYNRKNKEVSLKKFNELKAAGEAVTKTKNKALSKPGDPVWRYKAKNVITESDWKDYVGSNNELKQDIKKGHKIEKTILGVFKSKTDLTYGEIEALIRENVLYDCAFYNSNILGKFFKKVKCDD